MSTQRSHGVFLTGAIPSLYLKTAAPIIVLMMMSGLLNLTDAWFLGVHAGEQALAAVTVSFPIFMLLSALGMLVAAGMSSLLARALGRGDHDASFDAVVELFLDGLRGRVVARSGRDLSSHPRL